MPTALPPHRAHILPEWIDYNGHLRDAYYGVILSSAIDGVMDHLGMDAAYRARTCCTLYTLEMHLHFLHEVKADDVLAVDTLILDADGKRIHAGCRFTRRAGTPAAGASDEATATVATGEAMLLHVHQGERPASAPFPPEVAGALAQLKLAGDALAAWGPGSRKIQLKRPPA
jgi:acyl-CoA thioester hydrolase